MVEIRHVLRLIYPLKTVCDKTDTRQRVPPLTICIIIADTVNFSRAFSSPVDKYSKEIRAYQLTNFKWKSTGQSPQLITNTTTANGD